MVRTLYREYVKSTLVSNDLQINLTRQQNLIGQEQGRKKNDDDKKYC